MIDRKAENRFFGSFTDFEKDIIINFNKSLLSVEADIFLIMARKAACLIDALIDIGTLSLNGAIVSERVLDMDKSFLENYFIGKKVAIIDDTIVSGTTISSTIKKLVEFKVDSIKIKVLTINERWYAEELLSKQKEIAEKKDITIEIEKPIKLTDADSIRFCYDIVKGLSVLPKPYDFDFPHYSLGKMKHIKALNAFSKDLNWIYYDTTSNLQADNNIFSYTGLPSFDMLQTIDKFCGVNISKIANTKIRFLGIITDKQTYSINAFPMVIFDVINKKSVDKLYTDICKKNSIPSDKSSIFSSSVSKLRFIQYYFSMCIMNCWTKSYCEINDSSNIMPKRDFNIERMLFTKIGVEILSKVSLNSDAFSEYETSIRTEKKYSDFCESKTDNINDDFILKTKLIEPFIHFYNKIELKCRKDVKSYDFSNYSEEDFQKKVPDLGRLNEGITFNELAQQISFVGEKYEYKIFASIFLDKMITRGIAVPITQEEGENVFRAYRHGEDAILGDLQHQMIAYTLSKICEVAEVEKLSKILTEKLISLFIKFGLREKWLDELTNDRQTLKSDRIIVANRHDLQGMRPQIQSGQNYWYTYFLKQKGYLIPSKNGGYTFSFPSNLNIEEKAESNIGYFYKSFGMFLKNYNLKKIYQSSAILNKNLINNEEIIKTIDEEITEAIDILAKIDKENVVYKNTPEWIFTKLASCIAPNDIMDALAVEVDIFHKNWSKCKNLDQYIIDKDEDKMRRAIMAVNNGQEKYYSYASREVEDIIKNMSSFFQDSIYVYALKDIIKLSSSNTNEERLELVITDLGSCLVTINFALRLLNFLILCRKKSKSKDLFANIVKMIKNELPNWNREKFESREKLDEKYFSSLNDETKIYSQEFIKIISDMIFYVIRVSQFSKQYEASKKLKNIFYNFMEKSIDEEESAKEVLEIVNSMLVSISKLVKKSDYEVKTYSKNTDLQYYNSAIYLEPNMEFIKIKEELSEISNKIDNYAKINETPQTEFPFIHILKKDLFAGKQGICILIRNDDNGKKSCNLLRVIKKHIKNINKIIILKNIDQIYSFRLVQQNKGPHFQEHDFYTLELFDELKKKNIIKEQCYLEIGDPEKKYMASISMKLVHIENNFKIETDDSNVSINFYSTPMINKYDIKFGIITALDDEFQAMYKLMLDVRQVPIKGRGAGHIYYFGYLPAANNEFHAVALCCIDGMGNNVAGIRATNMLNDMKNIKHIIMMGIAGGAPNPNEPNEHVRLGDVVISGKRGAFQYDFIKKNETSIKYRGVNINSSAILNEASIELNRSITNDNNVFDDILNDILESKPIDSDILHDENGNIVEHPIDAKRNDDKPRLFINSPIGSANILLKRSKERDSLRDEFGIKAFEMEGSGIADAAWNFEASYIIVRGICDYCDKYKNNVWHKYAAAVAAAYTKGLLKQLTK